MLSHHVIGKLFANSNPALALSGSGLGNRSANSALDQLRMLQYTLAHRIRYSAMLFDAHAFADSILKFSTA